MSDMKDAPASDARLPPDLVFLKRLVTVLTVTMILGLIIVIGLLVTRLGGLRTGPEALLPAHLSLPDGAKAQAVTLGKGWVAVVTDHDGRIDVESSPAGTTFRVWLPLLRPVFLHYPFDRETFQLRHQAMLGRDLMIAPVIVEGATEGRIYLPKGTWTNSLTGKKWHGPGWTSFAAPVGTAVAFIRAGSPREQMLRQALTP